MTDATDIGRPLGRRGLFPAGWLAVLILVLGGLAVIGLADGFGSLLGRPILFKAGPYDLQRRWIEEACVREGKSPNAVQDGRLPPPAAGRPGDADYPPWALVLGLLFTLPGWTATRVLFAAETAVAVAVLLAWAFGVGRRFSTGNGLLLAAGVGAIGVARWTLDIGQYTPVVCGLLAAAAVLVRRRRDTLAGVVLGVALVKFSVSLPFFACFLVKGRFKPLAVAVTVGVVTTAASWPMIHTPPWVAFRQASEVGARFADASPTPLKMATSLLHLPPRPAAWATAAGFAVVGTALMAWRRNDSWLVLFAIAAVAARFWTYHMWYDDVILLFPLVALGEAACREASQGPRRIRGRVAFLAFGLSLWFGFGFIYRWPVVAAQMLTWVAGLTVLLTMRSPSDEDQVATAARSDG